MRQTHGESVRLIAAELAQSVERLTAEREVASSIPGAGPLLKKMEYPNLFSAPPPPPHLPLFISLRRRWYKYS